MKDAPTQDRHCQTSSTTYSGWEERELAGSHSQLP